MGRIASYTQTTRTARNGAKVTMVTFHPDGAGVQRGELFTPAGVDYYPVAGDFLAVLDVPRANGGVIVGAIDPANAHQTAVGEHRIYARDSSGNIVATVWLYNTGKIAVQNNEGSAVLGADGSFTVTTPSSALTMAEDGSTQLTNGSGTMTHATDGSFDFNGFTISADGLATDSSGIGLDTHTHAQGNDGGDDTEVETDPPTAGS